MSTLHDYLNDEGTGSLAVHSPAADTLRRMSAGFRASPYLSLRRIECRYESGAIALRGRVASYFLKQMAQEVARAHLGGLRVTNSIEVAVRPGLPVTHTTEPQFRRAVG